MELRKSYFATKVFISGGLGESHVSGEQYSLCSGGWNREFQNVTKEVSLASRQQQFIWRVQPCVAATRVLREGGVQSRYTCHCMIVYSTVVILWQDQKGVLPTHNLFSEVALNTRSWISTIALFPGLPRHQFLIACSTSNGSSDQCWSPENNSLSEPDLAYTKNTRVRVWLVWF